MKKLTSINLFGELKQDIPENIIDSDSLDKIKNISKALSILVPDNLGVGFEFRFAPEDNTCDMSVMLKKESKNVGIILGAKDSLDPNWQGLINFCKEWSNPGTTINQKVETLWLEFDANDQGQLKSLPNLWISPMNFSNSDVVVEESLKLLSLNKPIENIRENLSKLLKLIPDIYHKAHFGMMVSREPVRTRLEVLCHDSHKIFSFVDSFKNNMPDQMFQKLKYMINVVTEEVPNNSIGIQIDILNEPEISGIEFGIPLIKPGSVEEWKKLVYVIKDFIYCDYKKCQDFLDWSEHNKNHLSHIKVQYNSNHNRLEAKGYYWVANNG